MNIGELMSELIPLDAEKPVEVRFGKRTFILTSVEEGDEAIVLEVEEVTHKDEELSETQKQSLKAKISERTGIPLGSLAVSMRWGICPGPLSERSRGRCVFNLDEDPTMDDCIQCHNPLERK